MSSISSRITLRDGTTMPLFGLGCYELHGETGYNAIASALQEGYRMFDTARFYGNEQLVGRVLRESSVKREDCFVVSKLDEGHHGYDETKFRVKESLELLRLDYLDLFLIHSNKGNRIVETWKALVELKAEGLLRSIGVSNFNVHHLVGLLESGMETPSVNQIEIHPWNQHKSLVEFCNSHNITAMGWSPLAKGLLFEDGACPLLDELVSSYGRSKAQIALRWSLQSGFVTIPKSSKVERVKENADIFSWKLSSQDMRRLDGLEMGLSAYPYVEEELNSPWLG